MTKQSQQRSKTKLRLAQVLTWGSALLLIGCYTVFRLPPSQTGYFVLLGLVYPAILFWNLMLLAFWFFRRSKLWRIPAVFILLGWMHLASLVQLSTTSVVRSGERQVRVVSWNVQLFGLYQWERNKEVRNSMFRTLQEEQADVLCFQEFYHSDEKGFFTTRDTLVKILSTRYYHERYTHSPRKHQYFGVIILSRYPIIGRGHIPFQTDANNYCIWADLKVGSDTVRVYNAHLQSVRLSEEDYHFVSETGSSDDVRGGSHRIGRKLRRAFLKREEQVKRVVAHVAECPHEIILCGDFNDPPHSWSYTQFRKLLKDSFVRRGNGMSNTLNHPSFPPLRIDYILHSSGLRALDYRRKSTADQSDHFPVTVSFALPEK